jgi:S-methylmethionine-dependent homocysteine/selenocysteine methylase
MPLREPLPQLSDATFITDGGMETTLIFHQGLELPHFASFVLLDDEEGVRALLEYFRPYVEIARDSGVGIALDTPTWRANLDWGERLGYSPEALADVNRRGVRLLEQLREEADGRPRIVICGCVGPRGDGYQVGETMTAEEAERYHSPQVDVFAETAAELVSALTMTYAEEATGIVRAARAAGIPAAVSFTVETDGRLPSGQPLREAIEQVDAETDGAAVYFMINCAHPTHFADVLKPGAPALERVHDEPRRARRGRGARRRRSRRPGAALRRTAAATAEPERRRRLLRHRPPAHQRDLPRLVGPVTGEDEGPPPADAGPKPLCFAWADEVEATLRQQRPVKERRATAPWRRAVFFVDSCTRARGQTDSERPRRDPAARRERRFRARLPGLRRARPHSVGSHPRPR